jgi:hypothetical protein
MTWGPLGPPASLKPGQATQWTYYWGDNGVYFGGTDYGIQIAGAQSTGDPWNSPMIATDQAKAVHYEAETSDPGITGVIYFVTITNGAPKGTEPVSHTLYGGGLS